MKGSRTSSPGPGTRLDPSALQRLGRIDLIARVIGNAMRRGLRRSRRHGFSTEFSDFKAYNTGDDLRFLDWKIYARTDRLLVRKYEAETSFESILLLDASKSMAWRWERNVSKLEYGANICAALAYIHVANQDLVGALIHDARNFRFLPPRSSNQQLDRIFELLTCVEPGSGDTLPGLIETVAGLKRHRGQIVICSDLEEGAEDLVRSLDFLAGRDDEIVVLHLLDRAEIELPFAKVTHLEDSETEERIPVDMAVLKRHHEETVADFSGRWRARCREWGFRYVGLDTGLDYFDAMLRIIDRSEP